jgi:hypothetical protein
VGSHAHLCGVELQAGAAAGVQLEHRGIHLPALGGGRLQRRRSAGKGGRGGSSGDRSGCQQHTPGTPQLDVRKGVNDSREL